MAPAGTPGHTVDGARDVDGPRAARAASHHRRGSTGRAGYLSRRGSRFFTFSAIGGSVFVLGFALQAALTSLGHVPPLVSYLVQAVFSVELSFLLNRWLTWRDRDTPFWVACARFNAQKTVTVTLNFVLYAGLLRLGMNYLLANILLTAVFTVVNYLGGDRWVFTPPGKVATEPAAPAVPAWLDEHSLPGVSVVIPCRDNERTIEAALRSLVEQDYPGIREILLIGSPGDSTWDGLRGIVDADPRLTIMEFRTPPGVRDANFKRDAAIRMTTSDLVCLVDSDIVLPRDWMSRAVAALLESQVGCVAGGMKSIREDFWGRFTDATVIGAKTPRVPQSYIVNNSNFGAAGRKPPITANVLFTRELYEACPIDPLWSHGSYEDYEWFWRVTSAGFEVLVSAELFGWHHHRQGLGALIKEYKRSSRGCAFFIRAHPESSFSRLRTRQAVYLPILAAAVLAGVAAAILYGYAVDMTEIAFSASLVLMGTQLFRSRRLEALAYPFTGLVLGLVFTAGLITHLIRSGAGMSMKPTSARVPPGLAPDQYANGQGRQAGSSGSARQVRHHKNVQRGGLRCHAFWRTLSHPLTVVLAVQALLSLTLVWSNTAFSDEANYLWLGHLEIQHWLHGTWWPSVYADAKLSGSPIIYPPIGAAADAMFGLAGARILSMIFMLGATALLYSVSSKLFGRVVAVVASTIWVVSEPALKLAFATYDPLSVFITALSVWMLVRTAYTRHRGEFVAVSALVLALANAIAFSGVAITPIVLLFAFLMWLPTMGAAQAGQAVAWLTGAWAAIFTALVTVSHSWNAIMFTIFARHTLGYDRQNTLHIMGSVWSWSGIIIVLAILGAVMAVFLESKQRAFLLAVCGIAVFVVPIAQIRDQTSVSLDKHLAYGAWFGAIAAGYACSKLIDGLLSKRALAISIGSIAIIYPGISGWTSAWQQFHGWANAKQFVSALLPIVDHTKGVVSIAGGSYIPEYYSGEAQKWKQDINWTRWNKQGLHLDPTEIPPNLWESYYSSQLKSTDYGVIAIFYATNLTSPALPGELVLSPHNSDSQRLLNVVVANTGHDEPGLSALTSVLENDPAYRLAAIAPYNSQYTYGIYAIWQRVSGK